MRLFVLAAMLGLASAASPSPAQACAPTLLGTFGGAAYRLAAGDDEVFVFMSDGLVFRYAVDAQSRLGEISRFELLPLPADALRRTVFEAGVSGDRLRVIEEFSNTVGGNRSEIRVTVYDISVAEVTLLSSRTFPALLDGEFTPARARSDGELLVVARDGVFEFYLLEAPPDAPPAKTAPGSFSLRGFAFADGVLVYWDPWDEFLIDARGVGVGGDPAAPVQFSADLTDDYVFEDDRFYFFVDTPSFQRPSLILDVSDPATPAEIGTFGSDTLLDLAFGEGVTAVLRTESDSDERRVLDVFDGVAPAGVDPIGTLCLNCDSVFGSEFFDRDSLQIVGSTVIIESEGVLTIDVSDPTRPAIVERLLGNDFGLAVQTDGDLAYAANNNSGWSVYDISDPARPISIRSVDTADDAWGLYLDGSTLYVTVARSGVEVFDVSVPAFPLRIGAFPTVGAATDVLPVPGGLAVSTNDGIEFFSGDPSSGFVPRGVIGAGDGKSARDLVLRNDLLYAATIDEGLLIVDAADLDDPVLLASARPDGLGFCEGVAIAGDIAYLASWDGIGVVGVSDPLDPLSLGVHAGAVRTNKLSVKGNLLYGTGLNNALSVFSILDPETPRLIWSAESDPETPDLRFVQAVEHWIEGDRIVVHEGTTNRTVGRGLTIWELPELCDVPCSDADLALPPGVLDLADLVAFIEAFTAQSVRADLAPSFGVWDLQDIVAFVGAFTAGCP